MINFIMTQGDPNGLLEVLVGQLRIDDLMAVLHQEGRLVAARSCVPAVEKEDFHGAIVSEDAHQKKRNHLRGAGGHGGEAG
jgi:hypothetical protein